MSDDDTDKGFNLAFDKQAPTRSLDKTDKDIEAKQSVVEADEGETLASGKPNVQRVAWVKDSLWKQVSIAKKDMRVTWNEFLVVMLNILRSQKRISDGAWREIESIMELEEQSSLGWIEWEDLGLDGQRTNLMMGLMTTEQKKTRLAVEDLAESVNEHEEMMLHIAELEIPEEEDK